MTTGWICHRRFADHETSDNHPEHPERLPVIIDALEASGLMSQLMPLTFEEIEPDVVASVHEPAYIELVRRVCEQQLPFIGSMDTRICQRSYDVALLAAGGVLAACEAVMDGQVRNAFCAVRPPGHHAECDQAGGFCLFNNVAIAAEQLIQRHGLGRIAIVDFDVHHGNGTQQIFEDRGDVLYVSLHEDPESLYPGSGSADQTGVGAGEGLTVNVPMIAGAGDVQYRRAFEETVMPAVERFRPQFLMVSAGFDGAMEDAISHIDLSAEMFEWMTRQLCAAADRHCDGRLVSVLEGGYNLSVLGRDVAAHVGELVEG